VAEKTGKTTTWQSTDTEVVTPQTAWRGEPVMDLDLFLVDTSYGVLRVPCPRAQAAMQRSVLQYGQLTPVVVGRSREPARYELVDGFKRLGALQKLGIKLVKARIMEGGPRVLKAAIVQLNHPASTMSDLEEALVVRSLYREDGLQQDEIAVLFGRHKSWVCRRIALVERLCEEVHAHLRLGLVGVGIARELVRLPRGNQERALRAVLERRLTRRQAAALVSSLVSRPRGEHDSLLSSAGEATPADTAGRRCDEEQPATRFYRSLEALHDACITALACLQDELVPPFSAEDRLVLGQQLESIRWCVARLSRLIEEDGRGAEIRPEP
jgi:ParB/RepB/Spo0J family partition protein